MVHQHNNNMPITIALIVLTFVPGMQSYSTWMLCSVASLKGPCDLTALVLTPGPFLACKCDTAYGRVRLRYIVQELCESRGGRPELSVLTSLLVSVDVKIY